MALEYVKTHGQRSSVKKQSKRENNTLLIKWNHWHFNDFPYRLQGEEMWFCVVLP